MLEYINSLGLDAQKTGNDEIVGCRARCCFVSVESHALLAVSSKRKVGPRQDRLRGGRGRRPDFTFNLPMAQLLITQQTPVQTSHFPSSERPFVLQLCIYFITIPGRPETIFMRSTRSEEEH
jgi:hypothetical protein